MTQAQLQQRLQRTVTPREFRQAQAMYIAAGDIDIDTFCREYERISSSPLVTALLRKAKQLDKQCLHLKDLVSEASDIRHETADHLLRIAADPQCPAALSGRLESRAWFLIGRAGVIRRKAVLRLPLSQADAEYLDQLLDQ